MYWFSLAAGAFLMLLISLAAYLIIRHREKIAARPAAFFRPLKAHLLIADTLRLLKASIRTFDPEPEMNWRIRVMRILTAQLLEVQQKLRLQPWRTQALLSQPQLLMLAQPPVHDGSCSASDLLDALSAAESPLSASVIAAFPLSTALVICQKLQKTFCCLLSDEQERRIARKLLHRLHHTAEPTRLLKKTHLGSAGQACLLSALCTDELQPLLSAYTKQLQAQGINAAELSRTDAQQQLRLTDEIRQCSDMLLCLNRLDWLPHCASADPLHSLLCTEASGTYVQMDVQSQLQLRLCAEAFSRHAHLPAEHILRHALELSQQAEKDAVERYIGFWLQDAGGARRLLQSLQSRRGWCYPLTVNHSILEQLFLWTAGGIAGFLFLHTRGPVVMLPFFLLAAGSLLRRIVFSVRKPPLPAMKLTSLSGNLRTLVVVPAILHDPHEAIHTVRQLKVFMKTLKDADADFLLLGDFAPGMTAVSSSDASIIQAAMSAVHALEEDKRVFYLQRARTWDGRRRCYCPRGGQQGAVSELCRLIVHGECRDVIAASTVEPAGLERKYAYVLPLSPDCRLAPGSFEKLLRCITHPLCTRRAISGGWRGFSILTPENTRRYEGVGLIRPDVFLEATDCLADDLQDADALLGALAGHAAVPGTYLQRPDETLTWDSRYASVHRAWRLWQWQLPHVQTAAGLIRNPLSYLARFQLREGLRDSLVPLARCLLILYSAVFQRWLTLLLALASPELLSSLYRPRDFLHAICHLALLPTKMTVQLCAIWDAVRGPHRKQRAWLSAEVWAQGLAATILTALGLAFPGFAVPSLALGILFACFPLAHKYMDAPVFPSDGLEEPQEVLLDSLAASTWQYFDTAASAQHALPTAAIQHDPPLGASPSTTPEAIAASLLALVCTKELGYLSAPDAAKRIQSMTKQLFSLPMPLGIPCSSYALPSLTILDASAQAGPTGFYLAALMTTAQALRCWLPELPDALHGISSKMEQLIQQIDLSALYDPDTGLFHRSIDENGQGTDDVSVFTDEALLLSLAACARGMIPPSHFQQLQQPCVRRSGVLLPLSMHGDAVAHLMPALFFPIDENTACAYLRQLRQSGRDNLWGQSACACWKFDPQLRYQRDHFGVASAALSAAAFAPVFTPYAAALCLPFMPREAADCLLQFQAKGALGPLGFADAIDLTQGASLVKLQDTFHQGVILLSLAHLLADAPIQRYFTSLPEVEACLPLLKTAAMPITLPALQPHRHTPVPDHASEHCIDAMRTPCCTALLGDAVFSIAANAAQFSDIRCGDIPLTQEAPPDEPHGLQLYLKDEGRVYRLGDPRLGGDAVFAAGEVRYEQLTGSLKAELIVMADSVRQQALHILVITNLSTSDRSIEAASFLLPGLGVPADTLEAARPEPGKLCLLARGCDRGLYHTISASVPPYKLHACTDAVSFLGRNGTLHCPASLEHASADICLASGSPCLSFRGQFQLGGRGQITLWFTTAMTETTPPSLTELSGLRSLCAMQQTAAAASIPISAAQTKLASVCYPLFKSAKCPILHLSGADRQALEDLQTVLRWYQLHGYAPSLQVVCEDSLITEIQQLYEGFLPEDNLVFISPEDAANHPLAWHLHANRPLAEQLFSVQPAYPESVSAGKAPVPALLPEQALIHAGSYGGFDPDTGDYIIQLKPGEATPAAWTNRHHTKVYTESTDESGLQSPFAEQVFLQLEDETWLSPFSPELPRSVRMAAAHTSWEAWSDTLDVRLTAACIPAHRCAQRILRLRNATDAVITVTVYVAAKLSDEGAPLRCEPGIVMTNSAELTSQAWLAGEGWEARRIHSFGMTGPALCGQADAAGGTTAFLTHRLQLAPHASGKAVWLSGFARDPEAVKRTLVQVQSAGASALLRSAQLQLSRQLDRLTVTTPEDTFDRLFNSILPRQAVQTEDWLRIAALIQLDAQAAKRTILQTALHSSQQQIWLPLLLLTDEYVRVTKDDAILDATLPSRDSTLLTWFRHELESGDPKQITASNTPPNAVFLLALAAKAMNRLQPDEAMQALSRQLLNTADTHLWHTDHYGTPLCLTTQCLAMLAFGPNHRTRQALERCWSTLYDRPHGLIRRMETADLPPLPGSPENGGMKTVDAVLTLHALFAAGRHEDAFELLRALNPLHHTDTPQRTAVFRCAPYLLHGGMYAAPLEAGQAAADGGDQAASLLYACIVKHIFGLRRHGSSLRLSPCVPADWEDFTLTLREGSTTWRISADRRLTAASLDGDEISPAEIKLIDDGGIHQIRLPLT
ncbi:MAG: hypothetical protein IJB81_03570 [Clostridia bacterium]|nr:hypothetical protein [Clostridia bacterium]